MKIQRIAVAVTIVNLLLMVVLLTKISPVEAQKEQIKSQVLRGSGLEITDEHGKTRASITFHDAVVKDGVTYPAGVLLRLINSKGQPSVKIEASEDGGGLSFSNESNGYIQLAAKEDGGFLKIKNADGKEQVIKP
jgi:hypothetical protein